MLPRYLLNCVGTPHAHHRIGVEHTVKDDAEQAWLSEDFIYHFIGPTD
jgi:hypothetical protein